MERKVARCLLCMSFFYFFAVQIVAAGALEIPRFLVAIHGGGVTDRFNQPRGVFFNENKKRIYIADTMNNRLVSFTDKYEYKSEFNASGHLSTPFSLVVNSRGVFVVVEKLANRVALIDVKAKKVTYLSFDKCGGDKVIPYYVTIDQADNLYLIDRDTNKILVFDKNFEYIRSIKVRGVAVLADVKVGWNGNIYILDTLSGSVYVLDPKGNIKLRFGQRGSRKNEFDFPVSLAVDSLGYIYVVDQHRSVVDIFTEEGKFVSAFGGLGWKEGKFYYPCYIFIDGGDIIYVVDRDNDRIQLFKK